MVDGVRTGAARGQHNGDRIVAIQTWAYAPILRLNAFESNLLASEIARQRLVHPESEPALLMFQALLPARNGPFPPRTVSRPMQKKSP